VPPKFTFLFFQFDWSITPKNGNYRGSPDISKLREFVERSCWKDNPSCIVTEVQEDDDWNEEKKKKRRRRSSSNPLR
jgi:hypothetical protein